MDLEEERLEDYLTGKDVEAQKYKIEIAGKAFNKLDELAQKLMTTISSARMDRSVRESPVPRPIGEYTVNANIFQDFVRRSKEIYHIIIGTRGLYSGSRNAWLSESYGTKLSHDIYELIEDAEPIPDCRYPLSKEEDSRKELNRLRMINAIYGAIFRKLSTPVASVSMSVTEVIKKEEDGFYTPSFEAFQHLLDCTRELREELDKCRKTLLQGSAHTDTANLEKTVRSAAEMAMLDYAPVGIKLSIDHIPPEVEIEGDEDTIRKAILNILMSKPFTLRSTKNPEVQLGYGQYGENAVVYVTDNGPTIPHQQADMIFTIAQENAPLDDRVGDIYAAQQSITSTGGEMSVENLERGVRMRVQLRTTPPPIPADTPLPSTEYSTRN